MPTILFVGTNDQCLALALFIQYCCKFAFAGDLLKTLRDLFRSKIASLHSSENHIFCGYLGLGFDFGIVWLAISQSLSIKVSGGDLHQDRLDESPPNTCL